MKIGTGILLVVLAIVLYVAIYHKSLLKKGLGVISGRIDPFEGYRANHGTFTEEAWTANDTDKTIWVKVATHKTKYGFGETSNQDLTWTAEAFHKFFDIHPDGWLFEKSLLDEFFDFVRKNGILTTDEVIQGAGV